MEAAILRKIATMMKKQDSKKSFLSWFCCKMSILYPRDSLFLNGYDNYEFWEIKILQTFFLF